MENEHGHKIETVAQAKAFLLAGNATATLLNPQTGNRFTFKIVKGKKDGAPHFVKVLTGPSNESDFEYLGCIFPDGRFVVTSRSRISKDAPSARAFAWTWVRVYAGEAIGPAEVWHEGRCGKCGRKLTVPESIKTGLGPICAAGGVEMGHHPVDKIDGLGTVAA